MIINQTGGGGKENLTEVLTEQDVLIAELSNLTYDACVSDPLPSLTNPGTAADLAEGKQLFDAQGNVVLGTKPEDKLPTLTNPGTAVDLVIGKELIDENGEVIYGAMVSDTIGVFYVDTFKVYTNQAVFPFVKGMTWGDYINSNLNNNFLYSRSSYYNSFKLSLGEWDMGDTQGYLSENTDGTKRVVASDLIQDDFMYRYFITNICCFVAGTKVLVSVDSEFKNIEDIREGDKVLSYNTIKEENYIAYVKKLIINTNSTNMAKIEFENGAILEMTDYHPILTTDGFKSLTCYQGLEKLDVGDIAKTLEGWSKIINIERYVLESPITTYSLDVVDLNEDPDDDTTDNFYANGIVVHNVCVV